MLYGFFNILTMAVLFGAAIFLAAGSIFLAAGLIFLAVTYFLEADWETRCFIIFMAVLVLSMGFQIFDKIRLDIKTREVEQHKINN